MLGGNWDRGESFPPTRKEALIQRLTDRQKPKKVDSLVPSPSNEEGRDCSYPALSMRRCVCGVRCCVWCVLSLQMASMKVKVQVEVETHTEEAMERSM